MSQPGWYPDPAGTSPFRYWDGERWTERVSSAAGPVAAPSRARRLPGWLIGVLVIVVIGLLVVAVIRLTGPSGVGPVAPATEDSNSSTPTVQGWDEGVPTPDPSGAAPVNCESGSLQPQIIIGDDSVTVGPLTLTSPGADWNKQPEYRMPLATEGYGYVQTVPEKIGWASSMSIGLVSDPNFTTTGDTARLMAQCVLTSGFYTTVDVAMDDYSDRAVEVDGTAATQADVTVRFDHPDLVTKGSKLRIIVIDSAPAPTWFFAAVPMERDDHIAAVESATAALRLA